MRYAVLVLTAVVISTGCNLPSPLEVVESSTNCLGPFYAPEGVTLNGEAIQANERLLKRLFIHAGLMESNKEFCESFGGIPIRYEAAWTVPCSLGHGHPDGCNDVHGIRLAHDGAQLAHELLHTYDIERLTLNTAKHPRWTEKGFYALAEKYEAQRDRTVYPWIIKVEAP